MHIWRDKCSIIELNNNIRDFLNRSSRPAELILALDIVWKGWKSSQTHFVSGFLEIQTLENLCSRNQDKRFVLRTGLLKSLKWFEIMLSMAEIKRVYKSYCSTQEMRRFLRKRIIYCHRKFELCALWKKYDRKNAKENEEMKKVLMSVERIALFRF